jgi:hypothetical protein
MHTRLVYERDGEGSRKRSTASKRQAAFCLARLGLEEDCKHGRLD